VDENGHEISGKCSGYLCIKAAWPGMMRTLQGDHARYETTYFAPFKGFYFSGDGCRRDGDGYYWLTGRVDDVINVSGHRIGTAEVESALVSHPQCAEAAVVGFDHEVDHSPGVIVIADTSLFLFIDGLSHCLCALSKKFL
jgi:acetyl-CoA synthetase